MKRWNHLIFSLSAFLLLSLGVSGENSASEANLMLMESPFGASSKFCLSIRLQPSAEGYVCQLTGGVLGTVKNEQVELVISQPEGRSIFQAFESADWDWLEGRTFAGEPQQRKMLKDGQQSNLDRSALQGYIIVASLECENGVFRQTRPLGSEKSDQDLLASFLNNASIKSAAQRLVLSASESSNAESLAPEVWNPLLGLQLDADL
jgi:hypothetical protein